MARYVRWLRVRVEAIAGALLLYAGYAVAATLMLMLMLRLMVAPLMLHVAIDEARDAQDARRALCWRVMSTLLCVMMLLLRRRRR